MLKALTSMLLLCSTSTMAADYAYDASRHTITMTGGIETNEGAKLNAVLKQHPDASTLFMWINTGGNWDATVQMSRTIKRHQLATIAGDICYSGCAMIWLAGVSRHVQGPHNPWMHLPGGRLSWSIDTKGFYAWFTEMNRPRALADYVIAHSDGANNEMTELTPSLLHKYGL